MIGTRLTFSLSTKNLNSTSNKCFQRMDSMHNITVILECRKTYYNIAGFLLGGISSLYLREGKLKHRKGK